MKTHILLAFSAFLSNKLCVNALEVSTATDNNAGIIDMTLTNLKRDGKHADKKSYFEMKRSLVEDKRAIENSDKENHPNL